MAHIIPTPRSLGTRHLSLRAVLRVLAFATLFAAAPGDGIAQEDELEKNSPFLPPGHNQPKKEESAPEPVRQTNGPISRRIAFRGIVEWKQGFQFSIFDKQNKRGYWLEENGSAEGIAVHSFDPDTQSLVVSVDGRSERVNLTDASDKPLPVPKSASGGQARSRKNQPPGLRNNDDDRSRRRRAVPRRRVVLPGN